MIHAILEYQFMQHAILASVFASIVCGIMGIVIIEKKIVMMSGGIAHTAYGGVGLGYFLGIEPIIGAFVFSIFAAFGIGMINKKSSIQSDVIVGLFWSFGMALGILFIAFTPGYPPDMSSYLFGNILSVTRMDLYVLAGFSILIILFVLLFFQSMKAYLFDPEFAQIIGIRTTILENIMLFFVAMTVVVLIQVVGIILVIALLTAPGAFASLLSKNFRTRIFLSILSTLFFCISGLWISYVLNVSSGAMIVCIASACFFVTYLIKRLRLKQSIRLKSLI